MSDKPLTDAEIAAAEAERAAVQRAHELATSTLETMGQVQPPMSPAAARIGDEPLTFVTVAKAFRINLDHHRSVEFTIGSYVCPVRLANDWWAKANGIVVQDLATIRDTVPLDMLSREERAAVLRMRADAAIAAARAAVAEAEAEGEDFSDPGDKKPESDPGNTDPPAPAGKKGAATK